MTKAKVNLKNVIAYLVGNMRYKLYYSSFKFLIRTHIQEQIDFRIKYMKKECYEKGECVICGCATTALQMANKACDFPCYPEMIGRKQWVKFKKGYISILSGLYKWRLSSHDELMKTEIILNRECTKFIKPVNNV